jgi:uncharacterized membrane protein
MVDSPLHPNRPFLIRFILARPRLFICTLVGLLIVLMLSPATPPHTITRLLIGWNVGAGLYLILAARMMFWSSHERMRTRALEQGVGRMIILTVVVTVALLSLAAILAELAVAKDMQGTPRFAHTVLAALTVLTSWAFTQVMFSLHYAHDYYAAEVRGNPVGLDFPGGHAPDYGDFLYFACVIGTSGQTADVSFTNRTMRRIGLVHCVLAFFFNTTLLALTVNIASGLL